MWLSFACLGFVPLINYAAHAGTSGVVPLHLSTAGWHGRARLIMTVHPKCACSHASLRELDRLLAHVSEPIDAHIVFVGQDEDTALLQQAMAISGVTIEHDTTGQDAQALGAETSGDVFFYDAQGTLRFHGGLTTARGHEGASPGADAILALVSHQPATVLATAAFGCRLQAK